MRLFTKPMTLFVDPQVPGVYNWDEEIPMPQGVGNWPRPTSQEKAIERTRRYVAKGRRFEFCTADGLEVHFVQTYRELVARDDDRCWDEIMDLQCEFDLRRVKAPIHLVAADFALFKARLERLQHVGPYDPIAWQEVRAELAELRERLSRPKH